jgi:hypothetical protein
VAEIKVIPEHATRRDNYKSDFGKILRILNSEKNKAI